MTHTDTIDDKFCWLQAAYADHNYDLALSLASSLKDTLEFEKQTAAGPANVDLPADLAHNVSTLPRPWADWARGWKAFKPLSLFETVGIERRAEPTEVTLAVPASDAADLRRELRVARVDASTGALSETPSQFLEEWRRGGERVARVVFLADVPAHGDARYLLIYGNPFAELPEYPTNLRVAGDDAGLDISNEHYAAMLSRQNGQLSRLVSTRQHGLELYAGGKGHGEPPQIDWGHDYVDHDNFQKLRVRNWARCPNHRALRGPLCAEVRRWGFPHSPMYPVFTPSRIHMDVTYRFYSGLPYFVKESRFDVIDDVPVSAMRDDEWVFSGYSFNTLLWIDKAGKLHEGNPPNDDLWGVGFYHTDSRDAFMALRLSHEAVHFNALKHGGPPTLNYAGHGQLWSRYPVDAAATLKKGASIRQKNAYYFAAWPDKDAAGTLEQLRHQLQNPLTVQPAEPPRAGRPQSAGALARQGETEETAKLKTAVWSTLREVKDEQFYTIDANVVDMGLVYDVRERNGVVKIVLTMPHRGRPVHEFFVTQGGGRVEEGIRERLLKLPGVRDVVVDFTWYPPWDVHRLSDAGRDTLGVSP